jgi:CPA1 family monovalent cation:H+ antiporter
MRLFDALAVLLVLAATLGWINHRYIGFPTTVGLMALGLALSLGLVLVSPFYPALEHDAARLLESIDFDQALLHGVLGFLLFAGALHIDLADLREHGLVIAVLATVGTLLSTGLVGGTTWLVLRALGWSPPLLPCLLFGALVSPTDPIAVLGMLKSLGAPRELAAQIAGESLFNDGVGVVIFLGLLEFGAGGAGGAEATTREIVGLFAREALGGAAFGLLAGLLAYWMLKKVDHYQVEILISLALVTGGYALADHLHLSAPIAAVVAGLLIGNQGRAFAMSERTREHLDTFWELIDEILNALLFVLLGLEVLVLPRRGDYVVAGLLAIPIVLLARFVATGVPIRLIGARARLAPHSVKLMTWSGLRGGISVALALSLRGHLPAAQADVLLVMTYVVVVFSVLGQGLSIKPVLRRYLPTPGA